MPKIKNSDEELRKMKESMLRVAASLHFALVHDEVDNGPFGSMTGTRAANAWTHLPEEIREKFPEIPAHATEIREKKQTYSVPIPVHELVNRLEHPSLIRNVIVAVSRDGIIAKNGEIPWRCKADMEHFKEMTVGKTVIMGRKTWESIPQKFRPLPGRQNIVVSSTMPMAPEDAGYIVARSVQSAQMKAEHEIFYIGGAQIYSQVLRHDTTKRLFMSVIDTEVEVTSKDEITKFPKLPDRWKQSRQTHQQREGFALHTFTIGL